MGLKVFPIKHTQSPTKAYVDDGPSVKIRKIDDMSKFGSNPILSLLEIPGRVASRFNSGLSVLSGTGEFLGNIKSLIDMFRQF